MTGASAWNRLFDETMASLKFDVDGEELNLESTLNFLSDRDELKREAAFHGLSKTLHGNERLFTHITNVLAKDKEISDRWHGFADIADSRHLENSVEREVVEALQTAVRAAYPRLSHRYYKMKAKWFGKDAAQRLGPQRAAADLATIASMTGRPRSTPCSKPMARSRPSWSRSPSRSSPRAGSTRRPRTASRRAPSRTRPCRRRIRI